MTSQLCGAHSMTLVVHYKRLHAYPDIMRLQRVEVCPHHNNAAIF